MSRTDDVLTLPAFACPTGGIKEALAGHVTESPQKLLANTSESMASNEISVPGNDSKQNW